MKMDVVPSKRFDLFFVPRESLTKALKYAVLLPNIDEIFLRVLCFIKYNGVITVEMQRL